MSDRALSIGGIVLGLITTGLGFFLPTGWIGWGCIVGGLFILAVSVTWALAKRAHALPELALNDIKTSLHAEGLLIRAAQTAPAEDLAEIFEERATGKLRLAVVEITNTVSNLNIKVADINSVKSQLFFREVKGANSLDIAYGAWMGDDRTWVDFKVGQPLKLIIAIEDGPGTCFTLQTDYEDSMGFQRFTPKYEYLEGASHKVMIQLIAGPKEPRLVGRFTFKLTTKPLFKIERS